MSEAVSTPALPASAPASTSTPPPDAPAKEPSKTDPPKPGETSTVRHKIKVDGKDEELTTEQLIERAQKGTAAEKRMQAVAARQKELDALDAELKTNPRAALEKLAKGKAGKELRDIAIDILAEEQAKLLEEDRLKALDPKERELEELRREKKTREEQEKKAKDEAGKKDYEAKVEKAHQVFTKTIVDTLELFPESYRRNDLLAGRVLDALTWAVENEEAVENAGHKVTPQFLADLVRKDLRGLTKEYLSSAADEDLDELVTEPIVEKRWRKVEEKRRTSAHPELTQTPQVRGPDGRFEKKDEKPAPTQAELQRRSYFGGRK